MTGWISGLPVISGPISVFLALDQGERFAADAAAITLQVTASAALHCFVFAWAARRLPWWGALLAGWTGFALSAPLLGAAPVPPVLAFGGVVLALAVMIARLPRPAAPPAPPSIPHAEIVVRVLAALVLVTAVTLGANSLGPRVSGILLGLPIGGSVLPSFAAALHGGDATLRLLSGFISGLIAFAAFHLVVATGLPVLGITATYLLACVAALAVTALTARVQARRAAA